MLVNSNIIEELLEDAGYSRTEKAKKYISAWKNRRTLNEKAEK